MLRIHHFMKHVCLHYPRTNASEHAMLHNMFFAPPSQNTKSVWCMLKHWNNHHGHALQCAGCVAWAGDVYHVIISMSKWVDSFLTCSSCNLFFSFCGRVQSWLNLKAPTTAQWTTVTLLLSHARPLQQPSAWCQAWRFLLRASSLRPLANTERYSWTSQALVPEFVILIQETFILFAVALVWTSEP